MIFPEELLLLAPLNEESRKNGCDEIDVHAHPGRHKRKKKKGRGGGENGFKPIVNFCLVTCLTMLTHPLRSYAVPRGGIKRGENTMGKCVIVIYFSADNMSDRVSHGI